MAQPNVSREPSMEEILASIRRIIESNEPVARGFDGAAAYETQNLVEDEDMYPAIGRDIPPAANQAGYASEQAPRSISLADLAERVRASGQDGEGAAPVIGNEPAANHDAAREAAAREAEALHYSTNVFAVESAAQSNERHEQQTSHAEQAYVQPVQSAQAGFAPVGQASVVYAPAQRQAAPSQQAEAIEEERGLLSLQAGEKVARSFEELAAAVDGQQRRSLDEIAEEMLRPMLQNWLDDNLPTLVERLVREEIERIARGPRR